MTNKPYPTMLDDKTEEIALLIVGGLIAQASEVTDCEAVYAVDEDASISIQANDYGATIGTTVYVIWREYSPISGKTNEIIMHTFRRELHCETIVRKIAKRANVLQKIVARGKKLQSLDGKAEESTMQAFYKELHRYYRTLAWLVFHGNATVREYFDGDALDGLKWLHDHHRELCAIGVSHHTIAEHAHTILPKKQYGLADNLPLVAEIIGATVGTVGSRAGAMLIEAHALIDRALVGDNVTYSDIADFITAYRDENQGEYNTLRDALAGDINQLVRLCRMTCVTAGEIEHFDNAIMRIVDQYNAHGAVRADLLYQEA